MPEEVKPTEEKKPEVKKKGILGKIKEATDDKEEQLAILSTFVDRKARSDFHSLGFHWGSGHLRGSGSKV